ncbi:hypothetical protein [Georgenia faecalis]|uniref:Recombinase A n=1 Tax=Georgenia faecalis TaxID=2483799 RepID=A0ABV9DF84_9MICO|nr:hypothetical protein [Georgenia faecalis]
MSVTVLRPPVTPTREERLAAARRALGRAETAVGVRVRLDGPTAVGQGTSEAPTQGTPTPDVPAPGTSTPDSPAQGAPGARAGDAPAHGARAGDAPRLALAGDLTGDLRTGNPAPAVPPRPSPAPRPAEVPEAPALDERLLPVPAALLPLFPAGGLRRGSVVQVSGSTSLLLALAAAAGQEAWSALAALPDVGLQAAAEAGLDLARVVMVPRPGPDAPAVLGALVDGFDVLVVGDCRALSDRDRRLLGSRLRSRESVLLTTRPWPGSDLVLQADQGKYHGLGHGWGVLQGREMTVRARGRALGAGRTVHVRAGAGGLEPVAPPDGTPLLGVPLDGVPHDGAAVPALTAHAGRRAV